MFSTSSSSDRSGRPKSFVRIPIVLLMFDAVFCPNCGPALPDAARHEQRCPWRGGNGFLGADGVPRRVVQTTVAAASIRTDARQSPGEYRQPYASRATACARL